MPSRPRRDLPSHAPALALSKLSALAALLASLGCSAPAPAGRVCSSPGSCGAGLCVVGRCRAEGSLPSPSDTLRVRLAPSDIAVLTSNGPSGGGSALPEAIALGRKDTGGVVVLLRFTATWRDDAEIASAYVVLEPVPGAPPPRRALTVEAARILEPWEPATATWGRQPRLSLPEKAAVLRPPSMSPARVDVTRFVREWPRRLPDDHGVALLIDGDDAAGAAYSMGITEGAGLTLEVYVR